MNPAQFRHRIEVHGNIKTVNRIGEETFTYGKLTTIWAEIIPQTGALQRQQADTILTNVTHKIVVRYSALKSYFTKEGLEDFNILKDMKIHFKGHKFEVKYAIDPYFKREKLEIFVQEVLG